MSLDSNLLDEIKSSIANMQNQMQNTYANLADIKITGESHDKTVKIVMSATYDFEEIDFDERALQGGLKEFKFRIREAWKNVMDTAKETTQGKTMELLKGMDIPEDIRNISMPDGENGKQDG